MSPLSQADFSAALNPRASVESDDGKNSNSGASRTVRFHRTHNPGEVQSLTIGSHLKMNGTPEEQRAADRRIVDTFKHMQSNQNSLAVQSMLDNLVKQDNERAAWIIRSLQGHDDEHPAIQAAQPRENKAEPVAKTPAAAAASPFASQPASPTALASPSALPPPSAASPAPVSASASPQQGEGDAASPQFIIEFNAILNPASRERVASAGVGPTPYSRDAAAGAAAGGGAAARAVPGEYRYEPVVPHDLNGLVRRQAELGVARARERSNASRAIEAGLGLTLMACAGWGGQAIYNDGEPNYNLDVAIPSGGSAVAGLMLIADAIRPGWLR